MDYVFCIMNIFLASLAPSGHYFMINCKQKFSVLPDHPITRLPNHRLPNNRLPPKLIP